MQTTITHKLFPTLVIEANDAISSQTCKALHTIITTHRATHLGVQRSNVHGWHSNSEMFKWGGDAAQVLAKLAINLCNEHSITDERGSNLNWSVEMWANVSTNGALNQVHAHPGAFWSVVAYIDDGRSGGEEDNGGQLRFLDPRFPGAYMYAPSVREAWGDGPDQYKHFSKLIEPRIGKLIAFPSWLLHSVQPYTGTRERISIAMNLYLSPPKVGDLVSTQ